MSNSRDVHIIRVAISPLHCSVSIMNHHYIVPFTYRLATRRRFIGLLFKEDDTDILNLEKQDHKKSTNVEFQTLEFLQSHTHSLMLRY